MLISADPFMLETWRNDLSKVYGLSDVWVSKFFRNPLVQQSERSLSMNKECDDSQLDSLQSPTYQ